MGGSAVNMLSSKSCAALLADPSHIFRRMWAAEPWGSMLAADATACWSRSRRRRVEGDPLRPIAPRSFFDQTLNGTHCGSNWYEAHSAQQMTVFPGAAPALLGFDDSIHQECDRKAGNGTTGAESEYYHCVQASVNILYLPWQRTARTPYNLCRNLEWLVCALTARLPGQPSTGDIRFAKPPKLLDPSPNSKRPLGRCRGYRPPKPVVGGVFGYGNVDIYYLEVCLVTQLCENGDQIFRLRSDDTFVCDFSPRRFRALQAVLLGRSAAPSAQPSTVAPAAPATAQKTSTRARQPATTEAVPQVRTEADDCRYASSHHSRTRESE